MMKLHIASMNRKRIARRQPQWVYQQDMYRLRQDSIFDTDLWNKFRNVTLQEAHWIILFGVIGMLVGGMFILLWSYMAIDALNI